MAITNSKSLTQLVGEGIGMAYGTASLTDVTALEVETGLSDVQFAAATIETAAAGVPAYEFLITYAPGSDRGKISIAMIGATGTTVVRWMAIGIGQR